MRAKLGDIATYINGYAFKPSDWSDEGRPIIRIQDLTGNSYQANRFSGEVDKKYNVSDGDVLISWSASLGVYVWKGEDAVLNQHIFKVVFDKAEVNKSFFIHQVENILENAGNEAHGATMKHLTKPVFDALPFYLPSMKEQNEIAERLDMVSRLIALKKDQLDSLDLLVKSKFVEMFGDPLCNEYKWEGSTIGECFTVTSGGTPSTDVSDYWEGGTIPWLGSNMCQNKILYTNDGKFITEEGYANSSAKWIKKGSVLVALVGATIGKTALLQFDATTNQNIAAIDVNGNDDFASEFVFYHIQMLYNKFLEIGSGKFKMANQSFIRQLPLMCPPVDLQSQFASFVQAVDREKERVKGSLRELETLKRALMQEYFG